MEKILGGIALLASAVLLSYAGTVSAVSSGTDATSLSGLYESEYDPINGSLTDGLLEDFESEDSFGWSTSFAFFYQHSMTYTATINKDAAYVSNGQGSLSFAYGMASYLNSTIYPSLYFAIPTSANDFDGTVKFSFDYCNLSDVDLGFYVWALGDFSGGGYTYKYSADNANSKGDLLTFSKSSAMSHMDISLNVDFGKYDDGETEGGANIPRNVKYLRLLLPQTGSGEAVLYLDNVRIVK
jgi:hypothetical protein